MKKTNNENIKTKVKFAPDESTYASSYKVFQDVHAERFRPKRETSETAKAKAPHRTHLDLETFKPLKHQIPIGLMAVPNDVTGRNPLLPIKHIEIPEDMQKEEVIKTRPRIFKSPQVSLDDVPDPEMRKMIVDYTYTSDFKRTERELFSLIGIEYREVPETVVEHDKFLTTSKKHYFTVYFKPKSLLQIEMTKEQNLKGKEWQITRDAKITEQSKYFWKHNIRKYGTSYENVLNLLETKTKDEIHKLVENDKLKIQHDLTHPGYTGFKADIPTGIDLCKKNVPHNHPLLSTYQEAFSWRMDPKSNPKTIS